MNRRPSRRVLPGHRRHGGSLTINGRHAMETLAFIIAAFIVGIALSAAVGGDSPAVGTLSPHPDDDCELNLRAGRVPGRLDPGPDRQLRPGRNHRAGHTGPGGPELDDPAHDLISPNPGSSPAPKPARQHDRP